MRASKHLPLPRPPIFWPPFAGGMDFFPVNREDIATAYELNWTDEAICVLSLATQHTVDDRGTIWSSCHGRTSPLTVFNGHPMQPEVLAEGWRGLFQQLLVPSGPACWLPSCTTHPSYATSISWGTATWPTWSNDLVGLRGPSSRILGVLHGHMVPYSHHQGQHARSAFQKVCESAVQMLWPRPIGSALWRAHWGFPSAPSGIVSPPLIPHIIGSAGLPASQPGPASPFLLSSPLSENWKWKSLSRVRLFATP